MFVFFLSPDPPPAGSLLPDEDPLAGVGSTLPGRRQRGLPQGVHVEVGGAGGGREEGRGWQNNALKVSTYMLLLILQNLFKNLLKYGKKFDF